MKTHRSATPAPGPNTSARRKIFLVDDHAVTREGIALMIDQEPDLVVCGEAGDAALALEMISGADAPDLVIVDAMLGNASGLALLADLKALSPAPPVLILSMHDEGAHAERALQAGARGFVMKREPVAIILGAIRRVLDGGIHLSEAMKHRHATRPAP